MSNFILGVKVTYDGSAVTSGANDNRVDIDRLAASAAQAGTRSLAGGRMAAQGAALAKHEVTNLSYQMNDIVMMLASGQSPFMLMMQQGSQVAQIMGNRGLGQIIPALGVGLMSLITPTTLLLAGVTAVGYAGAAIFEAMRGDVQDVDELFKAHDETIRALKDAYGEAIGGVEEYGRKSVDVMQTLLRAQLGSLRDVVREGAQDVASEFAQVFDERWLGGTWRTEAADGFEAFVEPIRKLREEAYSGTPDIKAFQDAVASIAAKSGSEDIAELARKLIEASDSAADAEAKMRTAQSAIEALGGAASASALQIGEYNKAMSAMSRIALPNASRDIASQRLEEALKNSDMSPAAVEAAYAEYDAALKRIGEREAEAEAKRLANKKPPKDWGASITGRQDDELERLRKEIELLGASEAARARAMATMEAEQEIRRRGIDARSKEAQTIRDNAVAIAEEELALKQSQQAWSIVEDLAGNALNTLADIATGRSKDIGDALKQLADDIIKTAIRLAILNPLMNALFGSGLPTIGDIGGAFSSLFGGGGSSVPMPTPRPFADGGQIFGPGGPKDDRVLVRASPGEYIINAAMTARHLPLLKAINENKLPSFANGGRIASAGAAASSYMVAGAAAPNVNLSIHNYAGAAVSTKERQNANGDTDIEVILEQIDERIGRNLADGRYDNQLRRYGAVPGRRN